MLRHIMNGRNITLISPRRLGKTGLIFRLFEEIRSRALPYETIYMDISDTLSVEDFLSVISEAVALRLKRQQKISAFFRNLKSVRPLLGWDPLSGSPQVSFTFSDDNQKQNTLKEVLDYLENYPQKVLLAIDEFQQIREYDGIDMEAILRKHIQHLRNVRFIYCGSKKHTMNDMFTNAKKPFYESTSFCYLSKLPVPDYAAFIKKMFTSGGKDIDDDSIDYILQWTRVHTYYTQRLCNEVFSLAGDIIDRDLINKAIRTILDSETERFREIRRLITRSQWKMLKAIASEGEVSQITSSSFLSRYGISTGPTALRNIKALTDKELVLATNREADTSYSVYNVFLSRYLERS